MELMITGSNIELKTNEFVMAGHVIDDSKTKAYLSVNDEVIGLSMDGSFDNEKLYPARYISSIEGKDLTEIFTKLKVILEGK